MTVAQKLGDVAGVKARIRRLVATEARGVLPVTKILEWELQR